jgi:hypothetical protein
MDRHAQAPRAGASAIQRYPTAGGSGRRWCRRPGTRRPNTRMPLDTGRPPGRAVNADPLARVAGGSPEAKATDEFGPWHRPTRESQPWPAPPAGLGRQGTPFGFHAPARCPGRRGRRCPGADAARQACHVAAQALERTPPVSPTGSAPAGRESSARPARAGPRRSSEGTSMPCAEAPWACGLARRGLV